VTDWQDPPPHVAIELSREVTRILGDRFAGHPEPYKYFVVHPVFGRSDAVQFLRTVPTGTPLFDVAALADAWVSQYPTPPMEDDAPPPASV
jgi:hypothetical protein